MLSAFSSSPKACLKFWLLMIFATSSAFKWYLLKLTGSSSMRICGFKKPTCSTFPTPFTLCKKGFNFSSMLRISSKLSPFLLCKKRLMLAPLSDGTFSILGFTGRLKAPILSRTSFAATSKFLLNSNSIKVTLKLSKELEFILFMPSISLSAFSISLVILLSTKLKSPLTAAVTLTSGMLTLGNKFTGIVKTEIKPKTISPIKNISVVIGRLIASLYI